MRLCFVLSCSVTLDSLFAVAGQRPSALLLVGIWRCVLRDVTHTVSAMPMPLESAGDGPDRTASSGIRESGRIEQRGLRRIELYNGV
jgi:hypothetical protein